MSQQENGYDGGEKKRQRCSYQNRGTAQRKQIQNGQAAFHAAGEQKKQGNDDQIRDDLCQQLRQESLFPEKRDNAEGNAQCQIGQHRSGSSRISRPKRKRRV